MSETLSPMPPVLCLSARKLPGFHCTTLPDSTIARVSHIVSSKFIPWKQTAIASAAIW